MDAFSRSEILIAADVIYDTTVIDCLVLVVKAFLLDAPTLKQAIFAITKRNMSSFHLFLEKVREHDIICTWLASGTDCDSLPRFFDCSFSQERCDVQIARLTMTQLPK
jgi:hypothetical protein